MLNALAQDPDETARRRARILLEWADGKTAKALAAELDMRPAQIHKLTRAFLQARLEIFPPAAVERALRGASGKTLPTALLPQDPADLAHAQFISARALELFDATRQIHAIPDEWRAVLETGALLHNLGSHADADQWHHRVAHDVILVHDLEGFSAVQRDVLACLVLFNRKKVKPEQDALFGAFDDATKRITLALAAILRVADGLDYTKTQATTIQTITLDSIVEVVVAGKGARRNVQRANKKADLWREVLVPPLVARADANARRAAPRSAAPQPLLASGDLLGDAARKIIARQFEKLRALEEQVRANDDLEAVHDMRVACRRMNSALRLLRAYFSNKRVKKRRPVLEELRDVLGRARNFDVLGAALDSYRANAPASESTALQMVMEVWSDERAAAQNALAKLLDSPAYAQWVTRTNEFLQEQDTQVNPRVGDMVPALIWKQYGAVRKYETRWEIASLEELHALRIDAKRLRYTLEFFADAFGEKPVALIEPLVALQDHLGSVQDAVVGAKALTGFMTIETRRARARGEDAPDLQAIAAYHAHLQSRIAELRAQLPELVAAVFCHAYREALGALTAKL
ncbi:MAG: CHAD domain-containing protein [Chloroflexi bacterium]|nr:CHAD domain-containing protein [Chloroflexota bacterium]